MGEYAIGYALSGGFIKGFAHLGVIQALEEHGIRPDIIAGVSAGALAGVFYADGQSPREVLELFRRQHFFRFTRPVLSRMGLLRLDDLEAFLRANLRAQRIEELQRPFIAVATDFDRGTVVPFREGEIAPRIAASCCLPIVFRPVEIEGVHYVDGGVLQNLPVGVIRSECRRVLAVNVNPPQRRWKPSFAGIAMRTYHFLSRGQIEEQQRLSDYVLAPRGLYAFGNTELDRADEIFHLGYEAARSQIAAIRRAVGEAVALPSAEGKAPHTP